MFMDWDLYDVKSRFPKNKALEDFVFVFLFGHTIFFDNLEIYNNKIKCKIATIYIC